MSRLSVIVAAALVVGFVAVFAAFAAAQPPTTPSHPGGQPTSTPGNRPNMTHGANMSQQQRADWDNLSQSQKDAGLARAEEHRMFAEFEYADGSATGRFVSFGLDESSGVISDFTVHDNNESFLFFAEAAADPFTAAETPFTTGSVLHVDADNFTIMAHNDPTAIVAWMSGQNDTTLSFTLGEGVTANATGKQVLLVSGSHHGHLIANGNNTPEADNESVSFTLDAGEMVMFRYHAAASPDAPTLHEQNAALASGKLGAIVHVADGGGAPVEDRQETGVLARTTHIQQGKLELTADSDNSSGRVIFVTVDGGTLNTSRIDTITVKVSGVAATRLASVQQVLASTKAAVNITAVGENVELVINIPHFSTQTVTVEEGASSGAGSTGGTGSVDDGAGGGADDGGAAPGLGIIAILLAASAALVARRRL